MMQDYAILQLAGVKARLWSGSGSGLRASGFGLGLRASDFGLRACHRILCLDRKFHSTSPLSTHVCRNGDILT